MHTNNFPAFPQTGVGRGETATGQWGEWSSWTSCSIDCNTGITVRTRRCQHPHLLPVASLLSTGDDTVWCSGNEKEIKLCNTQPCSDGRRGWRAEECSKYDASVHAGQRYTWEPFVHPSDPCKLTCRAKGHHFYSNLADRVVDGTPCEGATSSPSAVCVKGVCKEVGCDGVVDSPWRQDACGVCRGDNSTCRTISGIFTRQDLSRGLHKMVTIPAGSTHINITGLRYSINRLALQLTDGDYFLNGEMIKTRDGDYEAAGTIFTYSTNKECAGQCVFAQGPVDQAVNLMLNTRGRNRGVMYSFNVPVNVTDSYIRRVISSTEPNSAPEESQSSTMNDNDNKNGRGDGENILHRTSVENDDRSDNFNNTDSITKEEDMDELEQYLDENNEDFEETDENDDDFDEENDDEIDEESEEEEEEEEEEEGESNSVSIPLYSVFDPNEVDQDSPSSKTVDGAKTQIFSSSSTPVADDGHETVVGGSDNNDDEESDLQTDTDDVGAPEPLEQTNSHGRGFKIIRKEKPKFIEPDDHNQGSFASSVRKQELHSNARSRPHDDDLDTPQDSHTHHVTTTASDLTDFDHIETTPTSSHPSLQDETYLEEAPEANVTNTADPPSEQSQADSRLKNIPTSEPDPLLRPQSDSPGDRYYYYRTRSGSSKDRPWRRFRRPKYSQSFTFRRRHQQTVAAESKGLIGDDRRSGVRGTRPRTRTHSTGSQTLNSRQIRFRPPPRGHSVPQRRTGSGHEQPSSKRNQDAYSRISSYSRSQSNYYNRRTPSQRQALTLGQSVSRDKDGTLQLQNRNNRSRGRTSGTNYDVNSRQYMREQDNRRVQQASSRQQQEYSRQQEEYRRELLRRRQQFEQQKAAQNAEYQRRLEEHNRRMRQRQIELQRRQQHNNDHNHHNRQNHNRHRHSHNNRGRQHHQLSAPTGGIVSRTDAAGSGDLPSRSSGSIPRQRTTHIRVTTTAAPTTPAVAQAVPDNTVSRQQQRTTNGRQQEPVPSKDTISSVTIQKTELDNKQSAGRKDQSISQTPAPTRDFLTQPAEQPVTPTLPAVIPNRVTFPGNPVAPQFIPEDPRYGDRSSLTAGSSNELPDHGDSSLVIGSQGNNVPNVAESGVLIGGGGSISANQGGGKTYEWRVSGLTDCTLTCGGGMQQTVVVCLDTRTQAFVTDGNCEHVQRPKAKAVVCNTRPCPAEWQMSAWSSCTTSCGPGEQNRVVTCMARISATLNVSMPEENCQNAARPEERRVCQNVPCNTWRIGNWSQCSVQCGEGTRTRDVFCVDQTGFDVSDDLCPGSKPGQEEVCEMGPCGKGWYFTDWPEQCPVQCGSSTMSRQMACLGEGGSPLPTSSCDKATRPVPQQPCKAQSPCGGEWFTGEWEQCNVTCGRGYRERDVVCMKTLPGGLLSLVGEENCALAGKPETLEPCEADACAAEWYMTSWAECTKSCGMGHRTREIKCLDVQQQPSSDCPLDEKPHSREACNTQSCTTRPPPAASDCQDNFSRCELVRHARMCRYPYYKKKCCATCAEDT